MEERDIINAIKKAYEEGFKDGHNQGLGCGHPMAGRCRENKELAEHFEDSIAARVIIDIVTLT